MSKRKKLRRMLESLREYRLARERAAAGEQAAAVRLCSASELPREGEARQFAAEGRPICLATIDGRTTAMDNACPHRGASLSEGLIEDGRLVCPWHGWAFRMTDGSVEGMPGERVRLYQLRRSGEDVLIEL